MGMRVNEAGKGDFPTPIYFRISWAVEVLPDLFDLSILNENGCVLQHLAFLILRDNPVAILDQ
jgi:hypothetical protein